MLKLFFRRAASPARARLWSLAAPWACAWLLGAAPAQAAETAPPASDPSDPFRHYQRWREAPLLDWRAANARAAELGGWRAYLRESQQVGGAAEGQVDPGAPGDEAAP